MKESLTKSVTTIPRELRAKTRRPAPPHKLWPINNRVNRQEPITTRNAVANFADEKASFAFFPVKTLKRIPPSARLRDVGFCKAEAYSRFTCLSLLVLRSEDHMPINSSNYSQGCSNCFCFLVASMLRSPAPSYFRKEKIMKRVISAVVVTMFLAGGVQADVIKPNDIQATSHFGVGENIQNLVNGDQGGAIGYEIDPGSTDFGLIQDPNGPTATSVFDLVHRISVGGSESVDVYGWITGCADAGISGGSSAEDRGADCSLLVFPPALGAFSTEPVSDQIIEFEFDGAYDITAAHIWNNNQDGAAPDRGLKEFHMQYSTDRTGDTFIDVGDPSNHPTLTAEDGFGLAKAQKVDFTDPNGVPITVGGVRRVRFLLDSAFFGDPNAVDVYVGLSEVRFEGTLDTLDLAADGTGPDLDDPDPNNFFNLHRGEKDGEVNGLDFLLWQAWLGAGELDNFNNPCCIDPDSPDPNNPDLQAFNSTLTSTQSTADYDNNNVTNHLDLAVWEAQYGMSSPLSASSGATSVVPEPFSLALMATAALGGMLTRWRRNRCGCAGGRQRKLPAKAGDRSCRQTE
jgi:hypothetical protein